MIPNAEHLHVLRELERGEPVACRQSVLRELERAGLVAAVTDTGWTWHILTEVGRAALADADRQAAQARSKPAG